MAHSKKYLAIYAVLIAFVITSCGSGSNSTTPAATGQTSNSDSSGDQAAPNARQFAVPVPIDRLVQSAIPDDIQPAVTLNVSYSDSQSNTLTSEQMSIIPSVTVEDMFAAYEAVVAANSGVPINTNVFSLLLVEYLNSNFIEQRTTSAFRIGGQDSFDDPPLGIFGLIANEAEKELLINNPQFIPATNDSIIRARGATLIDGGIANVFDTAWKDRSDAVRHSYWNWLLSDCCGLAWAEALTNAHESSQLNDDDTRMDLNNNAVGRAVYAANPSASAGDARVAIMSMNLLYVNESVENVEIDDSRLVYLLPKQTMTVFDDGPSFDDVFGAAFDGVVSSSTEVGGATTYEFVSIASGVHDLAITCEEDTTEAGCGFKYTFNGAMFNGMGTQSVEQIIIQKGETYSDTITFPKIIDLFTE